MSRIRSVTAVFLFCVSFCALPLNPANGETSLEHTVKAGLILRFSSFITWPDVTGEKAASQPLTLCLAGGDPFGNIFKLAREENIVDVDLQVRRLDASQDFASCHILYLSSLNPAEAKNILLSVRDLPVLVIGEQQDLEHWGGHINLLVIDSKVRFEINYSAIDHSGLSISSELLVLAHRVLEEKHRVITRATIP